MVRMYLKELAHARSGDKGDTSNICVFARDGRDYEFLKSVLTVENVAHHFGPIVKGTIKRYEVPSLHGFNFVMTQALGGGATQSLRQDTLGKSMASALLRMVVDYPDHKEV